MPRVTPAIQAIRKASWKRGDVGKALKRRGVCREKGKGIQGRKRLVRGGAVGLWGTFREKEQPFCQSPD